MLIFKIAFNSKQHTLHIFSRILYISLLLLFNKVIRVLNKFINTEQSVHTQTPVGSLCVEYFIILYHPVLRGVVVLLLLADNFLTSLGGVPGCA